MTQKSNPLVYLNEKSQANKDRYNNARRSLENRLNEMRNTWLSEKADEIELTSEQHYSKHTQKETQRDGKR